MASPNEHLIDVRSVSEFATGYLTTDIAPTVNIEYQSISQLADVYAARGIQVAKNDHITLYCRSGRRSNIALQTLKSLGYLNVRDIGGYEAAKMVLDKEQVRRQLDGEMELEVKAGNQVDVGAMNEKRKERERGFGALVAGLKDLEG